MHQATVENRRFGMSPNLLMDVIRRQAGTLQKGVLEAVMNAVDARATEIDFNSPARRSWCGTTAPA